MVVNMETISEFFYKEEKIKSLELELKKANKEIKMLTETIKRRDATIKKQKKNNSFFRRYSRTKVSVSLYKEGVSKKVISECLGITESTVSQAIKGGWYA